MQGGCICGAVRYRLKTDPMFVHCCHCTWCQRETGSAFAVNALMETSNIEILIGAPEPVATPSASGKGQTIVRCLSCRTAVWSHYHGSGPKIGFVRVGTLDHPHDVKPDVHIFTASRRPWVNLTNEKNVFEEYYDAEALWPEDSKTRRAAISG